MGLATTQLSIMWWTLHHPLETFYVLWNVTSLIEQIVIMFSDNVGYENSWNNAKIKQHNQA
jgi:hypothetical protein